MKSKRTALLSICFVLLSVAIAGASYLDEISADNPVYYCSFDTFAPGLSGFPTTIPEDLILNSGPSMSTDGLLGNSIGLNGTTDFGTAPGVPDPAAFSIEVWAKSETANMEEGALLSYRGGSAGYILVTHANNTMDIHIGTGAWYIGTIAVPNPDEWHQFVLTFDNGAAAGSGATSTANFYIDGVNVINDTTGLLVRSDTTGDVTVGGDAGVLYGGNIDEFSIYNTVLSEERIDAHFAAVPEPATIALLLVGGISLIRRRK